MDYENRIAALEATVAKLVSDKPAAATTGKPTPQEPFDAEQFEKFRGASWLDQQVKQPKSWDVTKFGEIDGRLMSELTKEQLEKFASVKEYGAFKEKQKPEPALDPKKTATKGKPCYYYEGDEFKAKLARSWAEHGVSSPGDADEIPF